MNAATERRGEVLLRMSSWEENMCFSRTVQQLRQLRGALAVREARRFVSKLPFELKVRVICVRPPNSRRQIMKNNMACLFKWFHGDLRGRRVRDHDFFFKTFIWTGKLLRTNPHLQYKKKCVRAASKHVKNINEWRCDDCLIGLCHTIVITMDTASFTPVVWKKPR